MSKVELLSPAGNMECLISAVQNGADAVYLGGKKFGARHFAANFDNNEMIEAIKYCHLYGVKIYVTVNTICYEEELDEAIKYIEFLYENHVDALIMQDLGLIYLVRKKFPNLEIHASTQAHNHNDKGLEELKRLGVKRAVLARELSLNEIKSLKCDIEKEVFIHGALCVSYSGCCLFSSMHGGRSGNRGECVGCCRLPYKLYENDKLVESDGKYLLSTKSLCTIKNINEILDLNIKSLKIEGRMKSKEYVGYITRLYRNKIDEYYKNKKIEVTDEEINNIKKLYNRELTNGYLFSDSFSNIMNIKTSNHIGIILGNVISINKQFIKIKLLEDLHQEDGVRFDDNKGMILNKIYDENGKLVNKVLKGNIAIVDNKIGIKKSKIVRKTIDKELLENINKIEDRKIPVDISCKAIVGEKLEITITDRENIFTSQGKVVEKPINCNTSKERIQEQLIKLGNTPFKCDNFVLNMDEDVFVSIKELNELRRELIEKLKNKREYSSPYEIVKNKIEENNYRNDSIKKLKISVFARTEEQVKACLDNEIDTVIVADYNLYKKYKKENVFYRTKRVNDNKEIFKNEKLMATELGAIGNNAKNNIVYSDYYLNVSNRWTIKYLKELGVKNITLSPELNKTTLEKLANLEDITLFVYGRVELMIMKYCPMNMLINKNNKHCNLCDNNKYYLKDNDNEIYPLVNEKHITHILDSKNYNLLEDLSSYISYGFNSFRIDLYDENENEINKIIKNIRNKYEHRYN